MSRQKWDKDKRDADAEQCAFKRQHTAPQPPPDGAGDELLPCPFCGKSDAFFERGEVSWGFIQCNDCGARGPSGEQTDDDEEWPGKANASAAWNRRPRPASPAAAGEDGLSVTYEGTLRDVQRRGQDMVDMERRLSEPPGKSIGPGDVS